MSTLKRYNGTSWERIGGSVAPKTTKTTSDTDTYSCNYVNDLTTYSTTEQVVGTWIDGKPLYRKVYKETKNVTSYSLTPPSNVNTYVNIEIMQQDDSNAWIKDYAWSTSNDYLRVFITNAGIQVRTSKTSTYTHWIIVEYTKTTD